MKTIVAISDTHGNVKAVEGLYGLFSECDYIVHLGDGYRDMKTLYQEFGSKIYQVDGNCDVTVSPLKYFILEVEDVKILLTHGDMFGVKISLTRLADFALKNDCRVALYGHTHQADVQTVNGVTLVNPGSLSYFTAQKSIAYIVVNGSKVVVKINENAVKNY